ncbi:septum formation initiator family protein [Lancefieldella rimae]|uniref:FtsB family cell division protein n=1 Tax=Lancefieldella rimae TaxID=1383 RepID=UPI0028E6DD5F|nr:septum formation initiator family protein [Lancefieldella rimae]
MSLSSTDKTASQKSQPVSGRMGGRAPVQTIGSVSRRGMDTSDEQARRTSGQTTTTRQSVGARKGTGVRQGATARSASNAERNAGQNRHKTREKKQVANLPERVRTILRAHKKLTVFICIVGVLLIGFYGPVQGYYRAIRDAQELQITQQEVEKEHKNLNEDVNRLQTQEGIQDKAHERGYVSEGETSVSVEGVGNTTTDNKPKEQKRPENPWYIKLLDFVFGYVPTDTQN